MLISLILSSCGRNEDLRLLNCNLTRAKLRKKEQRSGSREPQEEVVSVQVINKSIEFRRTEINVSWQGNVWHRHIVLVINPFAIFAPYEAKEWIFVEDKAQIHEREKEGNEARLETKKD